MRSDSKNVELTQLHNITVGVKPKLLALIKHWGFFLNDQ